MAKVVNEDKISFILYGSYEEQLNLLTDEQAGQFIKSIYVYNRTGEKQCTDPLVNMLLSVVCHQLDIDARKYAETKARRKEAGRKGGLQKAQNLANASIAKNDIANVAVYVNEDEDEDEDVDVNVLNNKQQQRQEEDEDTPACEEQSDNVIFLYGKNQLPTTKSELAKATEQAELLFAYYLDRKPKKIDIEKVFGFAYRPQYTADDQSYATFDQERADLLAYAFEQAAMQGQVKWSYIDTIMDKYSKNGIETAEQAQEYEYLRNRGEAV